MTDSKQVATTNPNPNLDKDKAKEQGKANSNTKGKSIRISDYEILRKYAFFNDTTVQNAVGIALEKLIDILENDKDFKIVSVSEVDKNEKKSIRLSEESMKQLKEVRFRQGASMMDVISAAVKLLD
ncbi:hypothetical protein [Rummeliibacillus stabekisii]|uniref:hypothetical protein n=1 Tax=Rummeliibacillus stabekisii TaxID=241244 RepID=UPI00203DE64E|nr:hypothetical protein [Rummeliibacillus stabekisii]